jgi:hypothetical protein
LIRIRPGPAEVHEAEQGGYILQGKIELSLPAEGKKIILGPGDGYLIGTKVAHSWETLGEETVLLDVFTPPAKRVVPKKVCPEGHGIIARGRGNWCLRIAGPQGRPAGRPYTVWK